MTRRSCSACVSISPRRLRHGCATAECIAHYGRTGRQPRLRAPGRGRDAKNMPSAITFEEGIADPEQLRPIPRWLAANAARRMKEDTLADDGLTLELETADFRTICGG